MLFNVKNAELSNGINLQYVERGDASGVPVIFLHGITDSWRSFELLLPHLPESIRAFALTQRGHGDSDKPETGYLPQDFAADVARFMDAVGLESAVIVGHSMGSFNAQRFAIDFSERALGIVLIDSFVNCRDNPNVTEFYETEILKLTELVPVELVREFQESTFAQPIPADFLETVINESLKLPARLWKETFKGLISTDFSDELGKIEAPTLIVWGEKDAYFPRSDQERLLEKIANSELLIYPGVGHTPQWEVPKKLAADLVRFIENLKTEKVQSRAFREIGQTGNTFAA
ncbi:MAG TPA: alpha/beta hydrolase [Pyrinomonadaceae bacterium]|nr:alpha/beta hydrolase [Pyrinomonadaceae bacterium]